MPTAARLAVYTERGCGIQRENVEPVLLLVPRVKAFALPGLSKRATLKAPRKCKYTVTLNRPQTTESRSKPMKAVYNTPYEAFCIALFLTTRRVCEVLTRQNQSVQLRLFLCIGLPTCAPLGFRLQGRRGQRYYNFPKRKRKRGFFCNLLERRSPRCCPKEKSCPVKCCVFVGDGKAA